jgi:clorobiocin/coumermycin A biosynthesis protein CloN6/CouN6
MKLESLSADLILLHPPALFDFRERHDVYFPFPGASGDVPITPLYDYMPLGLKSLQNILEQHGFRVKIINLVTLLVLYPTIDIDLVFASLDAPIIGISFHWMVHAHGALGVAERIKRINPRVKIIMGGISSTYFAKELIEYPFVDMVMRGYDTHKPMIDLLKTCRSTGFDKLHEVPNLIWKSDKKTVHCNTFSHAPKSFTCNVDWSIQPAFPESFKGLKIKEVISIQNTGCTFNCGWCGGSRDAFRRINDGIKQTVAHKEREDFFDELQTLTMFKGREKYHYYLASSYCEPKASIESFLDWFQKSGMKSLSLETFHLTQEILLKRLSVINTEAPVSISITVNSHDRRIAKLSGRGHFSNEELEKWLYRVVENNLRANIWYTIGMPEQDERSVMQTVEYCEHLMATFKGTHITPLICPMIPNLDPGCNYFEEPDKWGYKVFFRTVDEHRRGMERASLINRINYETKWLSRSDLFFVGWKAVRRMMQAKGEVGIFPQSIVNRYIEKLDDAVQFARIVHDIDCIQDHKDRRSQLAGLRCEIEQRNKLLFYQGVANQAFPINRAVGGRWFDDLGWSESELSNVVKGVL